MYYILLYIIHYIYYYIHYIYIYIYFSDNYGFVTFACKNDAYTAMEHGNDDPSLPTYDLSFGGRRAFCKYKYSDLGKEKILYVHTYTSTQTCFIMFRNYGEYTVFYR